MRDTLLLSHIFPSFLMTSSPGATFPSWTSVVSPGASGNSPQNGRSVPNPNEIGYVNKNGQEDT